MQATAKTCGCSYCVEGGGGPFQHFYPEGGAMTLDRAAFLKLAAKGPADAVRLETKISALDAPDLWACTIWLWSSYSEHGDRCGMASFGGYESRRDLIEAVIELATAGNLRWTVRG